MDKLKLPLSAFPERGLPIDVTVSEEEIRPEEAKDLSVGPVHVKGQLSKAADDYMFRGLITGTYHHTCDRCLDETEAPFAVDAVWVFTTDPSNGFGELSGEDEDLEEAEDSAFPLLIQNEEVDLRPLVWEEIVLNAPSKYLCREDCAGLCPQCGSNRNREECRCSPEAEVKPPHSGLARLAEILPDLTKKQEKE